MSKEKTMSVMKIKIRNKSYAPYLDNEGHFICPMPSPPPVKEGEPWFAHLRPYERLFYHQTLSSVRQCKRFVPTSKIPRDSLDLQLQSRYNHSREVFPEKVDSVMQEETCALPPAVQVADTTAHDTFRVLRNIKILNFAVPEALGHPLKIGGIREKMSPDSVKLITSGPHTQLVNNGFSRQPADGNFFRY